MLLLLLFIGALFVFVYLAHEVFGEKEEAIDLSIFDFLSAHVMKPQLTVFMKGVTYFASALFLQIAYGAVLIFYIVLKNWKRTLEILAIGMGGFLINYFMKLFFHRLRPPHPILEPLKNFSFPSGHATSGFIFYGLIAYLVWKTHLSKAWRWVICTVLILFSLLIGFSRIYLRMHYTSDVIAGFCSGFAWLALCIYLMERLKKKSHEEAVSGKS